MSLTQLETVETELKRTKYIQNRVLKLTASKRRSRGHQEHLKRIKDWKDTAETRFRGFSARNWASRGLNARNQGLKHNYAYKLKVYSVKDQGWTLGGKNRKIKGLSVKNRTWL
jgi:hypothetical protein